ncbi:hypothetical protein [Ligilactobacillus cholophilus]|uniref:hypothetical protein n=1 Tax=Ligilactobacillus cholophilus TaxID=3050131 RepID=UPI0025AF449E|nr:hypothetical protein [Ligilactobacillus cholophilus]
MFVIAKKDDHTIYSEWSHFNKDDIHVCWRTLQQIKDVNSYRNDNTHTKLFLTRYHAKKFIKENLKELKNLEVLFLFSRKLI